MPIDDGQKFENVTNEKQMNIVINIPEIGYSRVNI
jgi:hypothetical protein